MARACREPAVGYGCAARGGAGEADAVGEGRKYPSENWPALTRGRLLRVVWGDNLYQRRAAVGLRRGELRPEGGRLRLVKAIHLDQAFERVEQDGAGIRWETAAVSNDRDGFLVDLSEATECELVKADGPMDVAIGYADREPPSSGDYYYLRVEQLDTNKAWSSPVWVN